MIERLVDAAARNHGWMLLAFLLAAAAGVWALTGIPIDAVPDITSVQVVVNTKTGALDPEQVEKAVSLPIESEMNGIARVTDVRSLSKTGLSQVVVVFEDGTDIYWARQQISERLLSVREGLPEGLAPELAPITTGLGEVLMYAVLPRPGSELERKSAQDRLLHLRTVQDYVIRRRLKASVRNIAEVDSNGGYKKEIHIDVDPLRLDEHGLSFETLIRQVQTLGESFGGGYIEHEGQQIIVRTQGTLPDLEPIRALPVKLDVYGRPVRVRDVAEVREDYVQRLGAATYDGQEAVLGTVLMLSGANSRQVALDGERALAEMELPEDVEVRILYSRRFLVESTIATVSRNLAEGAGLVVVVLLLILGNLRAALIVSCAIPLSMLCAAWGMRQLGISANLMSLGAIDFGLLVDASVVVVENVVRRLEERKSALSAAERLELVLVSVKEVVRPVTVGLLLIMAVYLPILALEGIEGKVFRPMAQTVVMALGASLLVALLLMPGLAWFALRVPTGQRRGSLLFDVLRRSYAPVLHWSLRHRAPVIGLVLLLGAASAGLWGRLGADFMPPLDEGDMIVNLTRDSSISLSESVRVQRESDRVIADFDEVEHVFSRLGTPESATDPMGVHLSDTFVILQKDQGRWPRQADGRVRSKDELFEAIRDALDARVPGQEISQTQPIEMRFNEILEGSRADVTLRIYGPDLDRLIDLLDTSRQIVEGVPGASEVELDALTALRKSPVLDVRFDPDQTARHGLELADVNRLVEAAFGGIRVGSYFEDSWRFPVVVRLAEEYRNDPEQLALLPCALPDAGTVPLSTLATIERREHVTTIAHHQGERYAAIAINLAGRDTAGFVLEAQAALAAGLALPDGYRVSWGGQFQNLERARERLQVLVPLILVAIFVALLRTFGGALQALVVYTSIPFALTGGIASLYLREIPFSVSAAVGFIALIGIAILNAMVLVTFFNQLRERGLSVQEAVVDGALARFRPVLMTALVASLGFLPMAVNTGIGAEVQRPLATVVIGGLLTSTLLTLLVVPTLYLWVESRRRGRPGSPREP
jgi:cobalt-zinc-cadmium resistance protein CzcA